MTNREIAQALFLTEKTIEVHLTQHVPQARHPLALQPRPRAASRPGQHRHAALGETFGAAPVVAPATSPHRCRAVPASDPKEIDPMTPLALAPRRIASTVAMPAAARAAGAGAVASAAPTGRQHRRLRHRLRER